MGYAKYSEDIREEIEINLAKIMPEYHVVRAEPLPVFRCLYCGEEFFSNDELFSHMRLKHNSLPTWIQLNEKVLSPGEYIESAIESLRLISVKRIDSFLLNGMPRKAVINNGYIDLRQFQKNEFETLSVEVDDQRWTIFRSNICTVNSKVNDIVAELNDSVINRKRPDLKAIKQQTKALNLDIRDEQYIYGFYEYYLACIIESKDKDSLYFSAYNKLLSYIKSDAKARLALKIICLRYLWVDRLQELCRISMPNDFSLVCDFLRDTETSTNKIGTECSDNIFSLFVEDDEYENTQEIINFMNGDYNAVKRYLGKVLSVFENNCISQNLRDKTYLLQARMSAHEGEIEKARYYYNKILCPSIVKKQGG